MSLLEYLMSVIAKDPPSAKSFCSFFIGTFFVASARSLALQAEMDGFYVGKVDCTLLKNFAKVTQDWKNVTEDIDGTHFLCFHQLLQKTIARWISLQLA